jgi:hypothetical protein
MTIQIDTPEKLAAWIRRSPSLPVDQERVEVRIYASLMTAILLLLIIEPQLYLWDVEESLIYKVAALAPSPYLVAGLFTVGFLLILPHLIALLFLPRTLVVYWPRICATVGAFLVSVVWLYLSNLAVPLDLGALPLSYAVRSLVSTIMAGAYAFSVNAQQGREHRARIEVDEVADE